MTNPMTDELTALIEPFANYHGDLPDYDHPLRPCYESGIQYAVNLLAKELGVDDWTPCDGTEEFDGDLGGTLMNIVLAAMPKNKDGDAMWPQEVRTVLTALAERQAPSAKLREKVARAIEENIDDMFAAADAAIAAIHSE